MNAQDHPSNDKHPPKRPEEAAVDAFMEKGALGGGESGEPDEASREAQETIEHLTALRRELDATTDRALRFQAELENYRKRADRQIADERRYANVALLRDLLPVLDNMHRAVDAAEKTPGNEGLLEGFKLLIEQFEAALKRHHCEPIAALHETFDPNLHEAIAQQPSEYPANTIIMVTQVGYRLHDRVVRPSQVIISAGQRA